MRNGSDMSDFGDEVDLVDSPRWATPNFYGLENSVEDFPPAAKPAATVQYDHYDHRPLDWDSPQSRFLSEFDDNGSYTPDAPPGTAGNPVYDRPDAVSLPQYGEAWVDKDGRYHRASGAFADATPVTSEIFARRSAGNAALGYAKSYGSGLLGSGMATVAELDPFNPHGWANRVEGLSALGGWGLRNMGAISPDQYRDFLHREADFRHSLPNGWGHTTDEMQRNLGWYHSPQNRGEEIAETVGELTPAIVAPELAAETGPARITRMAERAMMKEGGTEADYLAGRALAAGARAVTSVAAPETARTVVRHFGGDEADQNAAMTFAGGIGLFPVKIGPQAGRPGDGWRLSEVPSSQFHDFSTAGWPREALPSGYEAVRRLNGLAYHTDGFTLRSTKGLAAQAAKLRRAELVRAAASGKPYQWDVGHSPDSVVTGRAGTMMGWLDQHPYANSSMGGSLGHRIGDHIRVFTIDGQPLGLPTPWDRIPYYGAMGGALYHERRDDALGEDDR